MDNESRRSFRDVYREERAKVRAEAQAQPGRRYVSWLGAIAFVMLGLTLLGAVFSDAPKTGPSWGLIIGIAAGLLWLVAKAVTAQNRPPS